MKNTTTGRHDTPAPGGEPPKWICHLHRIEGCVNEACRPEFIRKFGVEPAPAASAAVGQLPRDPTPAELESPRFNAIWNAIKKWDISRTSNGLYSGATGTDVCTILDALNAPEEYKIDVHAARERDNRAMIRHMSDAHAGAPAEREEFEKWLDSFASSFAGHCTEENIFMARAAYAAGRAASKRKICEVCFHTAFVPTPEGERCDYCWLAESLRMQRCSHGKTADESCGDCQYEEGGNPAPKCWHETGFKDGIYEGTYQQWVDRAFKAERELDEAKEALADCKMQKQEHLDYIVKLQDEIARLRQGGQG